MTQREAMLQAADALNDIANREATRGVVTRDELQAIRYATAKLRTLAWEMRND